jgi:hypothetical protein
MEGGVECHTHFKPKGAVVGRDSVERTLNPPHIQFCPVAKRPKLLLVEVQIISHRCLALIADAAHRPTIRVASFVG